MKKLLRILLCIGTFGIYMIASAFVLNIDVEEMKDKLISEGFPEEYFQYVNDQEIANLYEESKVYDFNVNIEKTSMNETQEVETRGHIDENMFEMAVVTISYKKSGSSILEKVKVEANYTWLKNPVVNKQDGMTINWDSNVFTFQQNSFSCTNTLEYFDDLVSYGQLSEPDLLQQGGLGYTVELKANFDYHDGKFGKRFGKATFYLLPTHSPTYVLSAGNSDASVTTINANYVHNRSIFTGAISFSVKGLGVTINAPALSDSASTAANFYYKR